MLFFLPYHVNDGIARNRIPPANGFLVIANVLLFCLGWSHGWAVGPGSTVWTILGYGFAHASVLHLAGNMWALLVFGNPVNRRLGNENYLLLYFGTLVALGLFGRLVCSGYMIGASGAVFAVIAAAVLLMPSAITEVFYFALFPVTLLVGLVHRPKDSVAWFIRWDYFQVRTIWGIIFVPFLEIWGLFWEGWNWTNVAHLFGLFCGVAAVLMLPKQVTMKTHAAWNL